MHECRVLKSLMDVIRLTQRNSYNYNLIYIVGIIECTVRSVHVTGEMDCSCTHCIFPLICNCWNIHSVDQSDSVSDEAVNVSRCFKHFTSSQVLWMLIHVE